MNADVLMSLLLTRCKIITLDGSING